MKNFSNRITAIILSLVLILCGFGTAYALNPEETPKKSEEKTAVSKAENNTEKPLKDETVYVLAGSDGAVKKIIVSDWIKNTLGEKSLSDKTRLSDIENVKGDEKYTLSDENTVVFDAQGNDIYYQGNINEELPVGLCVSYRLDGENISAEDLSGKSGNVTIRFDYENKQYETVNIDGKDEKIYVPFAMLTGMLLDSEKFRNVTVSNGKLFNDGENTAVIGIALPGLQENLNIEKEKFTLPDYVEINADVKDFSFGMTVTVATNEIFNEIDTEKLNSIEDLTNSAGELTAGMNKLINGSSELYGGLSTLLTKSGELSNGIKALADGAKKLKTGSKTLDDGAKALKSGIGDLSDGLNTLKSNNQSINDGAKQVFNSLLDTATEQINASGLTVKKLTIDNYRKSLDDLIDSLDKDKVYAAALASVTAAVNANRSLIEQGVKDAVRKEVEAKVTAAVREQVAEGVIQNALSMSKKDYDLAVSAEMISKEIQQNISAAIDIQMGTDGIKQTVKNNTDAQMETGDVKKTVSDNVEIQINKAISDNMASDEVNSKLSGASEGLKKIVALKTSLDSYNTFYSGIKTYTAGVATAADGAGKLKTGAGDLKKGTAELKNGISSLYDGIITLKNGVPTLKSGVKKLKNGAMQLNGGLKKLNDEGISKITSLVSGDLKSLVTRIKATVDVSKNYRNFSGISDDTDGKVKFIYRTEEINAE